MLRRIEHAPSSTLTGWVRAAGAIAALLAAGPVVGGEPIWKEDFEAVPSGQPIAEQPGWTAFRGFPGDSEPSAVVLDGAGVDGSRALAVAHGEEFRGDVWGLRAALPEPVEGGVVWLSCRFRPPGEWTAGIYFDARGEKSVVARIAGAADAGEEAGEAQIRWHASWARSYWRLYTRTALKRDHWYRLVARLDLDAGRYAAWVDDQALGEDLPLSGSPPVTQLFLGLGGTEESPAVVDEIVVSRTAPAGREPRALLPEPKEGLVFRFAAVGDPQVGMGSYESDLIKWRLAVEQVNAAGPELTVVLGDMVSDKDDEQAYRDVAAAGRGLEAPCYYVRGNHDRKDLYRKHFHPELDFSFRHKGVRFVVIDAEGNHAGLSEEQLAWIAGEFAAAAEAGEEIVACLHVSPWEDNAKGRAKYNQIGEGRERLRELLREHKVLLCLSGHYHRGLWHAKEEETHYLVAGGTAICKNGHTGWCVFDVYRDRIEMHQKPLFFAYEREGAERFYNLPYLRWADYASGKQSAPYLQQGPLVIRRHRPRGDGEGK